MSEKAQCKYIIIEGAKEKQPNEPTEYTFKQRKSLNARLSGIQHSGRR